MKTIFLAYAIITLMITACSSGKTTFERGNYYESVITSVNRLRRNHDHKKSIETLQQAYPLAVSYYEDRANTSLATSGAFKWTAVVDSYTFINTMYDEIRRCPGALAVIPNPVNYFSKLQEARQSAAEEHYASGLAAFQTGNRDKAKEAYSFFKSANGYVPGYKDVAKKMEEALWAATLKVLVESIPVHSKSVGVSAEFFNDKISEYVHSTPVNEFVRFFTRAEAQKIKLSPDHIIQLAFDDFTVGQVMKYEKETQLTKDSIELGTYVTAATANKPNDYAKSSNPAGGSGLLVSAENDPVVTTSAPNNSNLSDKEKADKELADKLKADKEAADGALAAKLKAEKEKADKALADKLKADQEQADKEIAEKLKAETERADKALADKLKADKEQADKEIADKLKTEKEQADKDIAEKLKADKEKADKEIADKLKSEKEQADKEKADKLKADKEKADKEIADKLKAEKEQADKAIADKLKADKEKADKEIAEKLKADKEKADNEKHGDPTINASDTTDVKDPVSVCHTPPGNQSKHKTLTISRSALKAHLGHGDSEGACDSEQNQKGKSEDENDKENAPNDHRSPGKDDQKKDGKVFLYDQDQVFFASSDNNIYKYLNYAMHTVESDTNKIYGTVKATYHQYSKSTTSKGVVSFKIIDAKTGALLSVQKMPGEFVWVSEWATFNGDERALSPDQLRISKQKEMAAPPAQDLFIEFTKPIYQQITSKIQDFYKGY
ncbi:MAG: hypothetical protein ABIR06_05850 [Cyclobacteriaceae bacterium]